MISILDKPTFGVYENNMHNNNSSYYYMFSNRSKYHFERMYHHPRMHFKIGQNYILLVSGYVFFLSESCGALGVGNV